MNRDKDRSEAVFVDREHNACTISKAPKHEIPTLIIKREGSYPIYIDKNRANELIQVLKGWVENDEL